MKEELQIAFAGNPNCGKTTLFNAYTGANLKVANWPGVTVEKIVGSYQYQGKKLKLVDLPGIYSLTSYTMEEILTRDYVLNSSVDVIINIVDASNLERNLYLTLQLIELGRPIVLALNMMDIIEERGMKIEIAKLTQKLGIPIIPVSARKKMGLNLLMNAVLNEVKTKKEMNEKTHPAFDHSNTFHSLYKKEIQMIYSDEVENLLNKVSSLLLHKYNKIKNPRWYALKTIEQDETVIMNYPLSEKEFITASYEERIINEKYDYIEKIIEEVVIGKRSKAEFTDKVDHILTHPMFGLPIFLCIMAFVFFLTFQVGDNLKALFEDGLELFSSMVLQLLNQIGVGKTLMSLIVDGIIAGVGTILTFLPNIFILFLALAYLEDSGYMSRVAYIMDGIMSKLGLSGRAFIPMLLGFGCSVPAIMASRTLENMNDRRRTILITPFMSCSARLPIYVLFSKMFFGQYAAVSAYSMYVIGIVVAMSIAYIMNKNIEKHENNTLLIELPEYKSPNIRTIFIYVWEKIKEYLSKAGTTIFVASVLIWLLLNLGPQGMVTDMSKSFGAIIGKALAPLLAPAGLGMWQIVVALISGIAAKEVVVSSFSVLFHVNNLAAQEGMNSLVDILSLYGFGKLNAYSLMVFCLLYIPCLATIGVIQKELKSVRWTIITMFFQLGVAWLVSSIIYQIGSLL